MRSTLLSAGLLAAVGLWGCGQGPVSGSGAPEGAPGASDPGTTQVTPAGNEPGTTQGVPGGTGPEATQVTPGGTEPGTTQAPSATESGTAQAPGSTETSTSAVTGWWTPHPGTSWQIQYTGTLNTNVNVKAFDLDLFDVPASTIASLHSRGIKAICYFSGGSYEDWRPDASKFPASVLGSPLDGWPGERWLDIRSSTVRSIMKARMDLAVTKKCDAVDPDNMDGYTNDNGLGLTAANQLDYNRFIANEAHARGLAVGLKNDLDQVSQLVTSFDFQVNEQCFQYSECGMLKPFITANKPVFNIEYGSASKAATICPKANSLNFDTLIKSLELGPERTACR